MKFALTSVFCLHLLLSNVCLMPMAMAAQMSTEKNIVMEIVMTPVEPMSSVDCKHCVHLQKDSSFPMSAGCAGRCLSQTNDTGPMMLQGSAPMLIATMPPAFVMSVAYEETLQNFTDANAPPPEVDMMHTVVLLL